MKKLHKHFKRKDNVKCVEYLIRNVRTPGLIGTFNTPSQFNFLLNRETNGPPTNMLTFVMLNFMKIQTKHVTNQLIISISILRSTYLIIYFREGKLFNTI